MCGIVGYIGSNQAAPILLEGLAKLEYRGYDSAGIAVCNGTEVTISKAVGKLANLKEKTDNGNNINGTKGIGHTRWATHGKPTETNAHPHFSERFIIVHNGIIENEEALRRKYLKNVKFYSDTDTEVIVHLLQKFTDDGESTTVAIQHMISEVEGSYALAIIDKNDPDVLYAVKNKSPLLIGTGDGFNMIGSDAMAMIAHTNSFYEINDKEYVILTKDIVNIYTGYGQKVERKAYTAELDLSDTEKGTYPHYMLKEIEEQPAVIRRILKEYSDDNGDLKIDPEIIKTIKASDKIYIIACGTSYHAGIVGKQFLEKIAGVPTEVFIASEFVYNMPLLSKKPLFVFISQSGETADSRAVLVKIKEMGYKSLTLTNNKGSTLSREADHTLLLYAGPEIAVASTKAYTAQVAVLAILAVNIKNGININLNYELSKVSNVIEAICDDKEKYAMLAEDYLKDSRSCFYIGRGMDYYVCLEAALKLKEISYIQTEGFAAGELKHGTIALIEQNTPVIAIISQENTNLNTRSNIKEVKSRGAHVMTISTKSLSAQKDRIILNDVHEILTPLITVVPAQYLAYYAALQKGCDIDKPRNLAKSVTVE
ncbi:MAG: glutamine--fructose-6-phosphate transaminase (isomerizing) [Clostridia bacterium]|nr:glutamine--fructose-6-phosphate transaminase (isomerizing) [Clostridia bacterium]